MSFNDIFLEASELVAESRFGVYESENVNNTSDNRDRVNNQTNHTNNNPSNHNTNNSQPSTNSSTNNSNTNNGSNKQSNSNNVGPQPVIKAMGFTKNDLKDPQKIEILEKKIKKERDVKSAKMFLRFALSIGSVALGNFLGAAPAVITASTLIANLAMNMHGQKRDNEMANMVVMIDKKIRTTQSDYMTETDPKKREEIKKYLDALHQAKVKLQNTKAS